MNDEEWMRKALVKAREALAAQEVAVGCIFVRNGEAIAEGRNTVNATKNPTRHAELNCIDQTLAYCKKNQLDAAEVFQSISVYVTVEPCVMCAEALHNFRVFEVVYGCKNDRFGGTTVFDLSKVRVSSYVQRGEVLADDAMQLLKEFYAGSNPNAPPDKRPKSKRKTDIE